MSYDTGPRSCKPIPCIKVSQPIGDFFIASIDNKTLCEITYFDIRELDKESRLETYLGIQRRIDPNRIKEISEYILTVDACFPTAVILSVPAVCAMYDESRNELTLANYIDPKNLEENIDYRSIAKVLDGQHRVEALLKSNISDFDINVSIFIDTDIAEEAYLFSVVNLAQTKVNKSLAYDLFEYATHDSPQKLCHNIAVALNKEVSSPFHERIKRLGVSTEGRFNETLTQATIVQSLIRYISKNKIQQIADRDAYKRNKLPERANVDESKKLIFRNMMIDNKDLELTKIILNYFDAVKEKWSVSWSDMSKGNMLNRTNGFKAFMRFLRHAYLYKSKSGVGVSPYSVPTKDDFLDVFSAVSLKDSSFNTKDFKPGSSGESALYNTLLDQSGLRDI